MISNFSEVEKAEPKVLKLKNKSGGAAGFIRFDHLKMDVRPSLVEYLRHGWKMDVSIAIDFSLSNLEITDYRSLHRLSNFEMNQYEKAIFEVCNVMTPYARRQKFNVYGFGAIPHYMGKQDI